MDRREHWESIYRTRGDTDLSWFQAQPSVSLSLIESLCPAPRRVIDVSGGQSALAGELLGRGVEEVTVLDISKSAIERGRERLGPRADRVRWIIGDVLEAKRPRRVRSVARSRGLSLPDRTGGPPALRGRSISTRLHRRPCDRGDVRPHRAGDVQRSACATIRRCAVGQRVRSSVPTGWVGQRVAYNMWGAAQDFTYAVLCLT